MESRQQAYRPVSRAAIVGLVLGLLSALAMIHWTLACIPILGAIISWLALHRIVRMSRELTGRPLAIAGLTINILFGVLGWGWLLSAHAREVPFGYTRISYEMLQPDPDSKNEQIPQAAYELEGKRVFVEGYMYPGRQQIGLKRFIICPAIPNCAFCTPDPKPTEMIMVIMEGDLMTCYTTQVVKLGGRFHIDREQSGGLPYRLQADYLR